MTWNDVWLPLDMLSYIKNCNNTSMLENIVHLIIMRATPKLSYIYICQECSHVHQPERVNEEVSFCPNCQSYQISYQARVSGITPINQKKKEIFSSKMTGLINQVYLLHSSYFGINPDPEDFFKCGFSPQMYWAQFTNGDVGESRSPKIAVMKAAILCPFVWDLNFEFENKKITPAVVLRAITETR